MFVADSIREVYAQIGSASAFRMRYFALAGTRTLIFPHRRDRCVTEGEIRVARTAGFRQTRSVDPQMARQSGLRRLLIFLVLNGLDLGLVWQREPDLS
jgi:hypothetical protein